jgi:hypothetical protein
MIPTIICSMYIVHMAKALKTKTVGLPFQRLRNQQKNFLYQYSFVDNLFLNDHILVTFHKGMSWVFIFFKKPPKSLYPISAGLYLSIFIEQNGHNSLKWLVMSLQKLL